MVRDVKSVLNEIRRVLAVDGIFLYIEHVHHERSWKRLAQNIVNPIWGIVFDGCNLTRDTSALVLEAGFSNVSQNKLYKPFGTFMGIFGHPTLVGIAIK
ncbi:thiol S-methyltransferase TMT1A-like [Tachypleus tridentatus]|uniref:thiol S-methyltransferase TMT1A-like n=1 Tax=Tachypleus tridentatus TaxID=6853 RepID=UPI003FD27F15